MPGAAAEEVEEDEAEAAWAADEGKAVQEQGKAQAKKKAEKRKAERAKKGEVNVGMSQPARRAAAARELAARVPAARHMSPPCGHGRRELPGRTVFGVPQSHNVFAYSRGLNLPAAGRRRRRAPRRSRLGAGPRARGSG